MNKKLIGIAIIGSGLIIIVGIIYIIFFYDFTRPEEISHSQEQAQQIETTPAQEQAQGLPTTKPVIIARPSQPSKTEVSQDDLIRMAAAFTERFGSYSNQSDYGNIRDLKIFMTLKMQDWAEDFIEQARVRETEAKIYYGITTKAITQIVKQFDQTAGQAEILVKTQRREAVGTTSNVTTFYQDIIIKFVREKGIWKVDDAYWQGK